MTRAIINIFAGIGIYATGATAIDMAMRAFAGDRTASCYEAAREAGMPEGGGLACSTDEWGSVDALHWWTYPGGPEGSL